MTMHILPTVRPLPYYTVTGSIDHALLAQSLRMEFVPKIARRLPGHHLRGFRHDTILEFVRKNKKRYPCFVRIDISKFYPSVRHRDMIVGMQIAYRDLLGLDYVPKEFKKRYVEAVNQWCQSLPLQEGIPLGSPLSAILAPLMLIPLWLELKRHFGVPFLVYMDDLLVLCENEHQCAEIYAFVANRLAADYSLTLHVGKSVSGRFSRQRVSFCGWSFSGGYATICEEKVEAFKERIALELKRCKKTDTTTLIKRLNRKIDGFGNYYKYGDVVRQFRLLDGYLRHEVRQRLKTGRTAGYHTNEHLYALGLHDLLRCYERIHGTSAPKKTPEVAILRSANKPTPGGDRDLLPLYESVEKISRQLTQLVSLERRQIRLLERLSV